MLTRLLLPCDQQTRRLLPGLSWAWRPSPKLICLNHAGPAASKCMSGAKRVGGGVVPSQFPLKKLDPCSQTTVRVPVTRKACSHGWLGPNSSL